jgi:hypothetical protein
MTPFLVQMFHAVRPLAARFTTLFTPSEPEPQDHAFEPADLAQLLRVSGNDSGSDRTAELDGPTWRDLLLERYLGTLSPGVSVFGRQALYRRLRAGASEDEAAASRTRIQRLLDDPAQLEALSGKLAGLRHADIEVATLLFESEQPARPGWVGYLFLLPLLLAASIVAALLVSPWGWVGVGVAMYYLVMVRMRYMERVSLWTRTTRALQMLLRTCSLLDGSGLPLAGGFAGRGAAAARLNRALSRSPIPSPIPDLEEYTNWFVSADVRHYFRTLGRVFGQRAFLRECYWLCAELEADVALARHLAAESVWCWADRSGQRTLRLEGGVHPLLDEANPLSIALDGKGAFLSGQNGVGKSTFLRMLGLNLAAARGFGFCYATSASLPALPVVASMQNEDSLLGGQSLYIAELARARELLAAAQARAVVCLIDEVFRGTNHEEAVSAASAVVDELAGKALVVVSSHNLVLGSLLAEPLAPWRIERVQDGGLRLEPGVLGRTNGVALLAEHGFDIAIQRKAERVAAWLAGQRHAQDGAGLLTSPARGIPAPWPC